MKRILSNLSIDFALVAHELCIHSPKSHDKIESKFPAISCIIQLSVIATISITFFTDSTNAPRSINITQSQKHTSVKNPVSIV